jgi:peptidyl-prolyl cis-trans isomerase B (cyclophilin B)
VASSTRRERELARKRAERQAARRAEAEARRRHRRATILKAVAALAVVAVAVTLVALNYDFDNKDDKQTTASDATCQYHKEGKAAKPVNGLPPAEPVQKAGTQKATLNTNRGPITLELLNSKAPCTVNSFTFLAAQKYFDNTSCHRVTQGGLAVVQCGDPTGSGTGGPGYQFGEENLSGATYPKGTLAMARTATPGTNGSQFFLVYADSQLDPDYTPFGTVTGGMDILTAVGKAGPKSDTDTNPKLPLEIKSVTIS